MALNVQPRGTLPARTAPAYTPPTLDELALAAALCWHNERQHGEVAAALGISRRTLARWKQRPEFEAAYTAVALSSDIYRQIHRADVDRDVAWHRASIERTYNRALAEYGYRRRRRKPRGWWS